MTLTNELSGDFLRWLSSPEECALPALKYIDDDGIDSIRATKHKSKSRSKSNRMKSPQIALVTDSMNGASSSDTFNQREQIMEAESGSDDESFHFDELRSAFSYYKTIETGASGITNTEQSVSSTAMKPVLSHDNDSDTHRSDQVAARNSRRKSAKSPAKQLSVISRKCVSCPDAARVSCSDSESVCSDASSRPESRVTRSLEDTMLRKYKQEEASQSQYDTGTTTIESIDCDYRDITASASTCAALDAISTGTGTASATSMESSIAFSSEEDSVDYDDNCSRVSYVSVYRSSPVEALATDATAASLDIMTGSIRLTYISPSSTPARPVRHPKPQRLCRTCTLDGLKYHPACPLSTYRSSLRGSGTDFGGASELHVMNHSF